METISIDKAKKREEKIWECVEYERDVLRAYSMYHQFSKYISEIAKQGVLDISIICWIKHEYPHLFTKKYLSEHLELVRMLINDLYNLASSFGLKTNSDCNSWIRELQLDMKNDKLDKYRKEYNDMLYTTMKGLKK